MIGTEKEVVLLQNKASLIEYLFQAGYITTSNVFQCPWLLFALYRQSIITAIFRRVRSQPCVTWAIWLLPEKFWFMLGGRATGVVVISGEVTEWLKVHAWKACVRL